MTKQFNKVCVSCGSEFTTTAPAQKKCDNCRVVKANIEPKVENADDKSVVDAKPSRQSKENIDSKQPVKPFLEVQTLASPNKSILDVYNKNPMYAYMWITKSKIQGANRNGIWHTVDKRHPDFKDLYVEQDDTPNESFFSTGDLILACCRMETYLAAKRRQSDVIKRRTEGFEKRHKENLDRISREGVKTSNKTFNEMESLVSDYSK